MSKKEDKKEQSGASFKRQITWVFGVALGLVLTYLIVSSAIESVNRVEYQGLTFTREKFEQLILFKYTYNTKVPITGRVTGNPTRDAKVELYLRVDPRENNVPVEGDEIHFKRGNVYVSYGNGLEGCAYGNVGAANLATFLTQNGFKVKGAYLNEQEAETNNGDFVTCENKPENSVIEVKGGDETKITVSGNCYEIKIANCEVMPAVEKLMIQSIIDAKKRSSII